MSVVHILSLLHDASGNFCALTTGYIWINGITNMTGMNEVINMKIGNKRKKYCQKPIQNHVVMYEIIFWFYES